MASGEKPPARPLFRKLAMGGAVVCFVLGVVFGLAYPEAGLFVPAILLVAGFVLGTIGATGYWPPRSK